MSETARQEERELELVESFERHGCYLVPHVRRELALFWNSETKIERRLARILDAREGGYAPMEFDRGLLPLIQTAPDAYTAYQWLRNSGEHVPTFRFFLRVCRAAGLLAADVLERESQVVQARTAVVVDAYLAKDTVAAVVAQGFAVAKLPDKNAQTSGFTSNPVQPAVAASAPAESTALQLCLVLRRPAIVLVADNLPDASARSVAAYATHRWLCHAIVVGDRYPEPPYCPPLTERHVELLHAMGQGILEPLALAERLEWDPQETRRQMKALCDALGAEDWTEAIRRCRRLRLVPG